MQAESTEQLDLRLKDVIESIFRRCVEDGDFKQAGTLITMRVRCY